MADEKGGLAEANYKVLRGHYNRALGTKVGEWETKKADLSTGV